MAKRRNITLGGIISLLVVVLATSVNAQDVAPVWVWLNAVDAEPDNAYLAQLERRAAEQDIALVRTSAPGSIPPGEPAVRLVFVTDPDGTPLVIPRLHRGALQLPSPDLYAALPPPAFALDDDRQPALDFTWLLLLYTLGRCDDLDEQRAASGERFFAGNCAIAAGDYDTAADALQQAADGGGYQTPVAFNLAWVYVQLGRERDAFDLMTRAVEESAPEAQVERLRARAKVYALAFAFDKAIEDVTQAIALAELNRLPPATLARLYKQRGDHIFLIYEWDRVLADYNTAIEFDPTYADAYFARGVLYYTQGPRPLAQADFERFLVLAPRHPRAPEAVTYIESIEQELEALGGDDTGAFGP